MDMRMGGCGCVGGCVKMNGTVRTQCINDAELDNLSWFKTCQ